MSQTLSDTLQPATLYSLTGFVGHPIGYGSSAGTTYTAELLAGSTQLSTVTSFGPEGTFAPFALIFDSTGSSAIGQPLMIRLSSNQPQVGFDGIALSTTPIPEPSTTAMLFIGATFLIPGCARVWRPRTPPTEGFLFTVASETDGRG
jgi:hypothetical protein